MAEPELFLCLECGVTYDARVDTVQCPHLVRR